MAVRELEKVRQLISRATELDLAYAYDDLVFAEHGIFIIRFDAENPTLLHVYFNQDCWDNEMGSLSASLLDLAPTMGFRLTFSGRFSMKQKHASEEIELAFAG
jgi:hypothetical protein